MSIRFPKAAMDGINTLFQFGAMSGWSDDQLVAQFLSGHDGSEAAFRTVLQRHGPMVLGVCRRVLGDAHAAEDAFQATFLVFVKKAATLRDRDLLTNWLYGVALRVAGKAKANAARRQVVESRATATTSKRKEHDPEHAELRSVIDEEIRKLPERFRVPLVLSYMEGLHHQEIAQRLGCPIGTVESRLSRARDQLRSRLARRGLSPAGAVVIALLAPQDVSAASPTLIDATIQTASGFWTGNAIEMAGSVATLVKQVAKPAVFSLGGISLTTAAACGGLVVAGLGYYLHTEGNLVPALAAAKPPQAEANAEPKAQPPPTPATKPETNTPDGQAKADPNNLLASRNVEAPLTKTLNGGKIVPLVMPELPALDPKQAAKNPPRDLPRAVAAPLSGIVIDGDLKDWPELPQNSIQTLLTSNNAYDANPKNAPRDPAATFMVGYDPKTQLIYLGVTVPDSDVVATKGDAWHTDALEVYVDGNPDAHRLPWFQGWDLSAEKMPVLQYVAIPSKEAAYLDPRGQNPSLVYGNIQRTATKIQYKRADGFITYECAIQAFDHYPDRPTRLGPGKHLGLDVAIVDRDRNRTRPAWMSWGPAPSFFKGVEPENLGEIILGDGATSRGSFQGRDGESR
ncbi:sigma-70 family RNA polymerase sigma factor [Singulisphaera sp. PoT]|uniref:sigma-70 family RNA polymerase sigma factor n=1 Tax=Singulisphaera sp. PoT TaxID=3411797 RepID=UPI003BF484A0